MENDRRSMSPGREKRVRVVGHKNYGKLSTKSPRLTSKGDRTLRDLLRDFATDKRAFINTSTILVDLYLVPIKARKILNDKEVEEMFCNIRQIIAAEQQALKVVEEELHGDEADVISIIKGMLENLNFFGAYCRNLPKALSLLVRCRKMPIFLEFEKWMLIGWQNRLQASTLGLDNLLSYPFEQVKRYDRILADWVPFFRSTELYPEFEVSRSRILDYIDELRTQVEGLIDKQKVADVIATIDPSSINCELYTSSTTFVKEGVVQVLVKQLFISKKEKSSTKAKFSKKPEEVLIYLFSDSIIVLRRKANKNNNKKKKAIELYDNKLLARIPLATSRFIVVSNATAQKVLQFVHDGLSYAFLFDNERVWRDWQKKIKAQVKEAMKKKIQKDKDHPNLPSSARTSKRGAEWGKKYHTMVTPQQPVVKTEVDEVPKTPNEFQDVTLFQLKHRTTSFNSVVKNGVKVVTHAPTQSKKNRDSTFEVYLRPRAFTIASTEYSIMPESFPVVEEPEFGSSSSFNSLKWAKVLNMDSDSPVNTPPVSPSQSKSLMSPRVSELVKKFSSELVSPRNDENNTNVIDPKAGLALPLVNANPIDVLSPRSLSNLYRPESISPRGRNAQVTAVVEKRPASPPRPSIDLEPKNNDVKPAEPSRGVNNATESPIGARKLLGRSGSIMIGGRSNAINNSGSNNSSSNSTPKISPRSATDPSLNAEAISEAGGNVANVSSPQLTRGWTRVASSGNLNASGLLNKNLKNSDDIPQAQTVIGARGSGSPRTNKEENNNNNLISTPVNKPHSIEESLKNDLENYDYDPDWQFGFTQDGRLYYYNTKLNQRTWERPKTIMPNPILDDVNAPHNWREMFSPQGYVYYLNVVTKQTSWFRTYLPAQHAQLLSYYNSLLLSALRNKRAENGATSPLASPKFSSDPLLDAQWKEVISPDGRRFYFNELTQTASWTPPSNLNLLNLTALSSANSILSPKEDEEKKTKRKKSKG